MKKILSILSILSVTLLLAVTACHAQTNTSAVAAQVPNLLGSLPSGVQVAATYLEANTNALTATNWTGFIGYSKVSGGASKNGFTFGAVYYLNPYIGTQIRMQYVDTGKSKWFLPNGTINFQSVYRPIASLPIYIRPMVELGAASDFSGNLTAIAGTGGEIDVFEAKQSTTTIQRISIYGGYEDWQGANKLKITQIGGAINLNVSKIAAWASDEISKVFSKL